MVAIPDGLIAALSDRYRVESEIGTGGMARVFRAYDLRHGRDVAIKMMRPDLASDLGAARFLHEIRIAARLTHPHILGVHDSGQADGFLYYVMPYVSGETLRALLARRGALPVAEAIRILRDLADALAYAHAQGVVHRDLKPENVLFSGGHAVIADFGIAKAVAAATQDGSGASTITQTGVALGTPAYMAPEQAVGDRNIDQRADLYALGVMAYEMLAGEHPFGTRSPQALVAAHITETPASLVTRHSHVPPALAALVMQLLAKEPAARPPDATSVIHALDAATPGMMPAARAHARWPRVVATIAAAALVATAGYASWRRLSARDGVIGGSAIRTLAVMPFENTGADANDEYFSNGMTDELAHALARLPGLQVAGHASTYALKGKALNPQEIGRTLDVAAMVSGTVRRDGNRLRVTTQLVGTRDGKVLWDSVYESSSHDVFSVQDEFTRAIAGTLARSLGNRPAARQDVAVGRGTASREAYDLFLKGQFFYLARGAPNVTRAIAHFQEAIAVDPAFARAYAALSQAYSVLRNYVADPADSLATLGRANADRAIKLDSTLADAHVALAGALDMALRYDSAEAHYRRGLALDPTNSNAHLAYGFEQLSAGRTDNAIREIQEALRLDPLVKSARSALALSYVFARRFPDAIAESRALLAVDSTFPLVYLPLSAALVLSGHADSAAHTLERSTPYTDALPEQRKYLLFAYATAGRTAEVVRMRDELRRAGGDAAGAPDLAFAELALGNPEPLVRMLSTETGQLRWAASAQFGCNPLLDPLWTDARFAAAMRALHVTACSLARPWPRQHRQ